MNGGQMFFDLFRDLDRTAKRCVFMSSSGEEERKVQSALQGVCP